jgi:hypothetical protein
MCCTYSLNSAFPLRPVLFNVYFDYVSGLALRREITTQSWFASQAGPRARSVFPPSFQVFSSPASCPKALENYFDSKSRYLRKKDYLALSASEME